MPVHIPEPKSDAALRESRVEIDGEQVMDVEAFIDFLRLRIVELENDLKYYRSSLAFMLTLADTGEIRAQQQRVNAFRTMASNPIGQRSEKLTTIAACPPDVGR